MAHDSLSLGQSFDESKIGFAIRSSGIAQPRNAMFDSAKDLSCSRSPDGSGPSPHRAGAAAAAVVAPAGKIIGPGAITPGPGPAGDYLESPAGPHRGRRDIGRRGGRGGLQTGGDERLAPPSGRPSRRLRGVASVRSSLLALTGGAPRGTPFRLSCTGDQAQGVSTVHQSAWTATPRSWCHCRSRPRRGGRHRWPRPGSRR
jgi:hypothetical protein